MTARIKSISVSGIRTLNEFKLDLDGLTVLIGENGSGKSTIVEACQLLKRLTNQNFWSEFNQLQRLDENKLKTWLDDYEGLGKILDAGYPESLFHTVSNEGH